MDSILKPVFKRVVLAFVLALIAFKGSWAGPIRGYTDCLNDEDCIGADRHCFRNVSMRVGKCQCSDGFKSAKEDPIKCLNIELNECHTNLDCPRHFPCVKHIPLLHAVNRVIDDQFYVSMKKECFAAFDPTLGGFRRTDDIFNQPFYFDHSSRLHSKYAKFHPSYIKFVEDAMLVLFLLCVLVTLLVVHRGSCYRQIRSARRNGPLRYIIPHPDDLPPPYSNYGPAVANEGQGSEGTRNIAPDVDDDSDKNRTETPPPSYDEALAISSNNPDNLFVNLPPSQDGAVALPPLQAPPIVAADLDDDRPTQQPAITTADIPAAPPSSVRLTGGRPFDV